jgi:hypothetical protein
MSTLNIVLIVIGSFVVLGLGTCALCVSVAGHEAKKFAAAMQDGGALVLESPPEVKAALAGAKSAYVGSWTSTTGSALVIEPSGHMRVDRRGAGVRGATNVELPIAAFQGDDIIAKAIVTITLHVSVPPHAVDGHQEMTVDGTPFTRP